VFQPLGAHVGMRIQAKHSPNTRSSNGEGERGTRFAARWLVLVDPVPRRISQQVIPGVLLGISIVPTRRDATRSNSRRTMREKKPPGDHPA